jgi:hypothetical protein
MCTDPNGRGESMLSKRLPKYTWRRESRSVSALVYIAVFLHGLISSGGLKRQPNLVYTQIQKAVRYPSVQPRRFSPVHRTPKQLEFNLQCSYGVGCRLSLHSENLSPIYITVSRCPRAATGTALTLGPSPSLYHCCPRSVSLASRPRRLIDRAGRIVI